LASIVPSTSRAATTLSAGFSAQETSSNARAINEIDLIFIWFLTNDQIEATFGRTIRNGVKPYPGSILFEFLNLFIVVATQFLAEVSRMLYEGTPQRLRIVS
jgi:hypothetical protein